MTKLALQVLYYNCQDWILPMLHNCGPFVDKIFVSYNPYPWTYNKEAREKYKNRADKNVVFQSKYASKIQLVEGVWPTEEAQRNHVLQLARKEGFDFMIVQDADEFYLPEDYQTNIRQMIDAPENLYYRNPWKLFWKDFTHVILFDEVHGERNTTTNFNPCFAVNLKKEVHFTRNRLVNTTDARMLEGLCLHMSYILSDEEVLEKLNTWGHAQDVKHLQKWYRFKWLGWDEHTIFINPMNPVGWLKAIPYHGRLPEEISSLVGKDNKYRSLNYNEKIAEYWYNIYSLIIYNLRRIKQKLF